MFFFFCLVLCCLLLSFILLSCSLPCCTVLIFACFYGCQFCSPAINQIFPSQSKGWFPLILLCWQEKYHWTGPLGLCINYSNMISELYQHLYSYTYIFPTEESKQTLRMILSCIMSCKNYELRKLLIMLCLQIDNNIQQCVNSSWARIF